jgi:hypothetical protein
VCRWFNSAPGHHFSKDLGDCLQIFGTDLALTSLIGAGRSCRRHIATHGASRSISRVARQDALYASQPMKMWVRPFLLVSLLYEASAAFCGVWEDDSAPGPRL